MPYAEQVLVFGAGGSGKSTVITSLRLRWHGGQPFTPEEIERFKTDKAFATEYRVTLENIMNVRRTRAPPTHRLLLC